MPRKRVHRERGPLLTPPQRVIEALEKRHGELGGRANVVRIAGGMKRLHRGLTLDRERFTGRPYLEDPDVCMAYATYMLCAQLPKVFPIMDRLYALKRLPNPLRVLEFGCGTGAGLAGIKLWAEQKGITVHFHATDFTEAALAETRSLAISLGFDAPRTSRIDLRKSLDSQMMSIQQPDLVLGMNVFNELPTSRLAGLSAEINSLLHRDTLFAFIEPAAAIASEQALLLRDHLVSRHWRVLGPCTHSLACPANINSGGWCHDVWRFKRPDFMAQVDTLIGTRRQTLKATWGILSKPSEAVSGPSETYTFARAVSERFEEKGRTRIKVCSAGELFELELQKRDRSEFNAGLSSAERYSLLQIGEGSKVGTAVRLGPEAQCIEIDEGLNDYDG